MCVSVACLHLSSTRNELRNKPHFFQFDQFIFHEAVVPKLFTLWAGRTVPGPPAGYVQLVDSIQHMGLVW